MTTLTRKGYGRIFVQKPEDIAKIDALIKELDEFEHSYLPEQLIAVYTEYPKMVYTHKFDALNMNHLTAECWKRGFQIWVCDNGNAEYIDDKGQPFHAC